MNRQIRLKKVAKSLRDLLPESDCGAIGRLSRMPTRNRIAPPAIFLLFSFVLSVAIQAAGIANLRASASKTSVKIAEAFTVRVEATVPTGSTVTFPHFEPQSALGEFEVFSSDIVQDLPSDNATDPNRIWTQTISLETIQLGQQVIPPVDVVITAGDITETLSTEPITIQVQSVLQPDDQTVREIVGEIEPDPPQATSLNQRNWLFPLAFLGFPTLAVAGGWWWVRRQRTPLRWCKQEIDEIAVDLDHTNQVNRIRELLRTLVSIHRDYFTPTPSTRQLIDACRAIESDVSFDHCQQALQLSDQAKFGLPGVAANQADAETNAKIEAAISETRSLLDFVEESQR